ncbi:Uu.00g075260.m01.CDS01 [Anthostomella pinea]|uniref:Uu.00g075260.m01.CDS01 n=1 Tax=Anthostomella pinea TaxID=933095 RepID=A0AAI8YP87_9PEZI|nr:Uu.00g075260.m01.CDS01 [Anthostomella pinea]
MFFKLFYVMSIIYNATLLCIKLSLFFQYYRLIRDIPRYSFIYIVIMGIITSWTIAQILVLSLICIPVQGYWDPTISAKCLDPDSVVWVNSIGNIVTDIIVLLLPMPVAWRLNLKKGQKWGVIGIFGLGFLTCVVSIFRLVFFTMMTADYTRDFVPFLAWSQAEMASGLICSALITLRPLVGIVFPAFRTIKKITNGLKFYKIGGGESGLGSRRKSANLDAKLTRRPSRDPFGGSETELTRRDELDTYRSCKRKVNFRDSALDKRRSVQSMKVARTAQKHERNVTAHRHDKFLGLESGVRTIISSGDNDSMISVSSPTIDGIMVKQVWTVGDKETRGDEDDIPQVPRSP